MNSVIRPFQEKDLDACADLYVETFARAPWNETWDRRTVLARLDQIVRTPGFFGLVAVAAATASETGASPETGPAREVCGCGRSGEEDPADGIPPEETVSSGSGSGGPQAGTPVGFVLGYAEPWHQGSHFYLKEMCVHPDRQRRGIGSRLMKSLGGALRELGARRIYLLTSRGGLSEEFYSQAGFYTSPKMILMARRFTD